MRKQKTEESKEIASRNKTLNLIKLGEQSCNKICPKDVQNDTENIPKELLPRSLAFLAAWSSGLKYIDAIKLAGVTTEEIGRCGRLSKAYKAAYNAVHDARLVHAARKAEDAMGELASGEAQIKQGFLPPDVRAADIVLKVGDPLYRQTNTIAPTQVSINLSI